jgi:hypothetical protein
MAEATALRNNALPYPVYGVPWTVVIPVLDADGDLVTAAAGLDSEVSLNGNTFADCTNEATEIATGSGMYYLTLTAAEMTADIVAVIVKTSTSGAKTTPIVLYPRKLSVLVSGTSQGGAAGYITLAAGQFAHNDQYNGCLCVATIDTLIEARILQDCTTSNQRCTVTPEWNVAPDADDTYIIYNIEGRYADDQTFGAVDGATQASSNAAAAIAAIAAITDGGANDGLVMLSVTNPCLSYTDSKVLLSTDVQDLSATLDVNAKKIGATTQTGRDLGASVLLSAGTGTGQLDFTSGVVKANLAQILGTALTETAGYLAAGFKKFFNIATPTGTLNSLPDAVAGAAGGLFIAGMNAATSVTTALTANITGNLSGSVGSVTGAVGSVTGAVGSVTGAVGSVTGAVGSVTAEVTANVTKISGDATAADNAESFFDGTGYAGTNNVIPTVTTTGTATNLTNLPAAAATAAELAKVPKSDSNVSWNATALAAINAEVDGALNTAIPGSPTANSINERVAALDDLTQASGGGDLAAIKGYVDDIGAAGAGLTAIPTIANVTTVATTTNLTNLPAVTTDWLTAAGVKADAVTKIQNGLATPTNITAGTITTVTNLTNAPTNGDLTATMKASVNAEVDTALNTVIPGSPTTGSVNARMLTLDTGVTLLVSMIATGAVVDNDAPDPSATAFETNLTETTTDHYKGAFVVFTSGNLKDQSRKITGYDGTTKILTVSAFTDTPAGGDTFAIVGRSE